MTIKALNQREIDILSFPDTRVERFMLDIDQRHFSATCSTGFLDFENTGQHLEGITIEISGFTDCKISEFSNSIMSRVETFSDEYALKDIAEFSGNQGIVILKGFSSKRGQWTEFYFSGGNLRIISNLVEP